MENCTIVHKLLPQSWLLNAENAKVLAMLDQAELSGAGAFSTVVTLDEYRILKITTCEATTSIYSQLLGKPYPGLPVVLENLGRVGVVPTYDNPDNHLPLMAFVVERLFFVDNLAELSAAPCPRGVNPLCARSLADAKGALCWLQNKVDAYLGEAVFDGMHRNVPEVGRNRDLLQDLTPMLRGTRFETLLRPLSRLHARVSAGEWTFDITERFHLNVMLSRWGEPILVDPVWKDHQPRWKSPWGSGYQT